MEQNDKIELQVERLLRACAITSLLKGFYPLRDLVLLYYRGEISPQRPRAAARALAAIHGETCYVNMRTALRHSWKRPECRLTQFMGVERLEAPPAPCEFALAICRQMKTAA